MKLAEAVYDVDLNEIFVTYETPKYYWAFAVDLNTKRILCINTDDHVEIPWPEIIPKEYSDMGDYLSLIGIVFGALCSKLVLESERNTPK